MEDKKKSIPIVVIFIILLFCAFVGWTILSAIVPYKPSKQLICNANIHSLSICCIVYYKDHDVWPTKENWCDSIKTYTYEEKRNIFFCPIDKTGPCSYAMNENIPADANELPPDLVLLFESAPGWNQVGGPDDVATDRHGEKNPGANIAFADGTVRFVKPENVPNLRWTVEQKPNARATR